MHTLAAPKPQAKINTPLAFLVDHARYGLLGSICSLPSFPHYTKHPTRQDKVFPVTDRKALAKEQNDKAARKGKPVRIPKIRIKRRL